MICVDSSIAIKWLLAEPDSPLALTLLEDTVAAEELIVVPALLFSEVTNVLRQQIRKGALTLDQATTLLHQLLALPFQVEGSPSIYVKALALSDQQNLPAAYDAHYIAVAQQHGVTLWTADRRLLNTLGSAFPSVQPLSAYQPKAAS